MSSQGKFSSTTIALLIAGLVIGAGGGYFASSSSLQPKINGLENQVSSLTSEVSGLTASVSALESEITSYESRIAVLETEKSSLESQAATFEKEIAAYESQIADLETDLTKAEAAQTNLEVEVERLQALLEAEAEETYTFAKYGFSFEYPEGWILSLGGLFETIATENSGMVEVASEDQTNVYVIGWISMISVPDVEYLLDGSLDGGFSELFIVELGERVTSTIDGHMLKYQAATVEGGEYILSVWYCNMSDYLFFITMGFSSGFEPADVESTMLQFLETFECH